MSINRLSAVIALILISACTHEQQPAVTNDSAAPAEAPASVATVASPIEAAVNGDWRSSEDRSRDAARHPVAALEFWGLAPGMTILEVQPGSGWWTEILAPYARMTGGQFYATAADLDNPDLSEGARNARNQFAAKFAAKPEIYGEVKLLNFGPKSAPLPANTFDFILTARSVHGWMANGNIDKVFTDLFDALKPGGILALEQHRANPGEQDPKAESGYVTEAFVIEHAKKAWFELIASSEINANPLDSKDHPFGVWTLPPSARTRPYSEGAEAHDPNFDRSKYDTIGESDRMTLKFRKPLIAPTAD